MLLGVPPTGRTISQAVDEYLLDCQVRDLNAATVSRYRRRPQRLLDEYWASSLDELTTDW